MMMKRKCCLIAMAVVALAVTSVVRGMDGGAVAVQKACNPNDVKTLCRLVQEAGGGCYYSPEVSPEQSRLRALVVELVKKDPNLVTEENNNGNSPLQLVMSEPSPQVGKKAMIKCMLDVAQGQIALLPTLIWYLNTYLLAPEPVNEYNELFGLEERHHLYRREVFYFVLLYARSTEYDNLVRYLRSIIKKRKIADREITPLVLERASSILTILMKRREVRFGKRRRYGEIGKRELRNLGIEIPQEA